MKQGSWSQLMSYLLVSVLAVGSAFLVSLKFIGHAHSQPAQANVQTPAPAPTSAVPASPAADKPSQPVQESASAVAAEVQGFLEPFIYDSKNRRDPFQPYAEFRQIESPAMLPPLLRYELEEFKLVGIMWDIHDPKAMLVDPERQVHLAAKNDPIGKKNGYIAVIREGEVVVVESVRKNGAVILRPKILKMER
jgi:type IV pilus assembly protein PilP